MIDNELKFRLNLPIFAATAGHHDGSVTIRHGRWLIVVEARRLFTLELLNSLNNKRRLTFSSRTGLCGLFTAIVPISSLKSRRKKRTTLRLFTRSCKLLLLLLRRWRLRFKDGFRRSDNDWLSKDWFAKPALKFYYSNIVQKKKIV